MDIENSNIQNSLIAEEVKGGASVTNNGPISAHLGSGNQYVACNVYNGPGWEEFGKLNNDLLSDTQDLLMTGHIEKGLGLLDRIINGDGFNSLPEKVKLLASSIYLDHLNGTKQHKLAKEYITNLSSDLKTHRVIKGWECVFQLQEDSNNAIEVLGSLLTVHPDSPSVLAFCFMSRDRALIARASYLLDAIVVSGEKTAEFKVPLLWYSCYLSDQNEHKKAIRAISSFTPSGEVEAYKVAATILNYKVQEQLTKVHLSSGNHTTVEEWQFFEHIIGEVDTIISAAKIRNHDYPDPYELKSLALSLLGQYREAIDTIEPNIKPKLSLQGYLNVAICYQNLSDWVPLEVFIRSAPETHTEGLNEVLFISLANQGKYEDIDKYAKNLPNLRLVASEIMEDKVTLEGIGDFKISSQIAVNRIKKNHNEEAVEFLINYSPIGIMEEFIKANSLLEIGERTEAHQILQGIFTDLGPGAGVPFVNYLKSASEKGERKRVLDLLKGVPKRIIYQYEPLAIFYIQFSQQNMSVSKSVEILLEAHERFPSTWLKVTLLQSYLLMRDFETMKELVKKWGIELNGDVGNCALYLGIVARFVDYKIAIPALYKLLLKNPKNLEVQKVCFGFFTGSKFRGDEIELPPIDQVSAPCAVALADSQETLVLIEDERNVPPSNLYVSFMDEVVAPWIGKKAGDHVSYDGESVQIKEILHPYLWLFRYSLNEVSKRPSTTSVRKISGKSVDENIAKMTEFIQKQNEKYSDFLETIASSDLPILTMLSRNANPLSAWEKLLSNNEGFKIIAPIGIRNETIELDSHFVFDPTSASSLFVINSSSALLELEFSVSITPSLHNYFQASSLNEAMEYSKSFSDNAKVIVDSISEERITIVPPIPYEDLTGTDLQLINILDSCTRDALFHCYKRDKTILVSDDSWIREYAKTIGITSISSYQLLHLLIFKDKLEPKIVDIIGAVYCLSSKFALKADALSVPMAMYLSTGKVQDENIKEYLDLLLRTVSFTIDHISILATILLIKLECHEFAYVDQFLAILRTKFIDIPESESETFWLIYFACRKVPPQNRPFVVLYLFHLFSRFPNFGPYCSEYELTLLRDRFGTVLNRTPSLSASPLAKD